MRLSEPPCCGLDPTGPRLACEGVGGGVSTLGGLAAGAPQMFEVCVVVPSMGDIPLSNFENFQVSEATENVPDERALWSCVSEVELWRCMGDREGAALGGGAGSTTAEGREGGAAPQRPMESGAEAILVTLAWDWSGSTGVVMPRGGGGWFLWKAMAADDRMAGCCCWLPPREGDSLLQSLLILGS